MLVYKGFIGQIDFDNETQQLVGEVINASDLLEFCGSTASELREAFIATVDEYISFRNEFTGKNPVPLSGNFTVCLTTDKQNKVIQEAQSKGQSVQHWLNKRIDYDLSRYFEKTA